MPDPTATLPCSGAVERYLHAHIPLSRAMGVAVHELREGCVELTAPLAPNINHRDTVFGGSASALAILAAWTAIHLRLSGEGSSPRLVIQRYSMSFDEPIEGRFHALCELENQVAWTRFTKTLARRGKARIHVSSLLRCDHRQVGQLEGEFVAVVTP